MRRLALFSLLMAAAVALVASCHIFNPDDPNKNDKTPAERISSQELTFISVGGTQTITISGKDDWTCESYSDWFKATKSGTSITVSADANTLGSGRSGVFTVFFDSGEQLKVTVKQTDADHDVEDPTGPLTIRVVPLDGTPEDEPALLEKTQSSVTYAVKTNGTSWEAAADQNWVSLTVNDVYLTVQCQANTSEERREANITVTAKRDDKTVTKIVIIRQKEDYKPPVYDNGVDYDIYNSSFFVDSTRLTTIAAADTAAHTVTFAKGTTITPEVGSVMVVPYVTSQLPEGLIGRVTSVTETADGYVVTYGPAAIEEAFASIDIPETDIDLGQHVKEIRLVDGTSVEFKKTKAPLKRGNVRKGTSTGSTLIEIPDFTIRNLDRTVAIDASATIDLGMKFSLQTYKYGLYYFGAVIEPTLTLDVKMDANVQCDFVKGSYPVMTVICGAFPLGPVVITPLVEISFVVGADGKVGLKADLKYVKKAKMKYSWAANGMGSQFNFEVDDSQSDSNAFSFEEGALYMEGGIYAGFDTSIGLGVFGTLIYGTVGCRETIRCGGTFSLDAGQIGTLIGSNIGDLSPWNLELSTDYVVNGVASIKSLGNTISEVKTDDYKDNIDKRYPFPQICASLVSQSVGSAVIDVYCRCTPIVPARIGVLVYAKKPGDETFTLLHTIPMGGFEREDESKAVTGPASFPVVAGHCWNKYTVTVPLDYEGVEYIVKPYAEVFGVRGVNYKDDFSDKTNVFNPWFISGSTAEGAFRGILEDLMANLKNDDPSARLENWGSDGSLNNWQGVIVEQQADGTLDMYVNPNTGNYGSKWYLRGDVYIGSHTMGKCTWTVDGIVQQDASASLTILDRNCKSFPLNSNRIKLVTDKFDDIDQIKVLSANSNLEMLSLTGAFNTMEVFQVSSKKLKSIELNGLSKLLRFTVSAGDDLEKMEITETPKLAHLLFIGADLSKLASKGYFLQDFELLGTVIFDNCTSSAALRFKNLPKLDIIGNINDGKFKAMEFTNCFMEGALKTGYDTKYYYSEKNNGTYYTQAQVRLLWADNLVFENCPITGYSLTRSNGGSGVTMEELKFKNCLKMKTIWIDGPYSKVTEDLRDIDISKVSIEGCQALTSLSIKGVGMREFAPSVDWSRLTKVDLRYNRMTGIVPSWLESAKTAMGGSCGFYDHKYGYQYSYSANSKYTEYDYGFWYSYEPDSRYHHSKQDTNGPDYINPGY